MKKRIILDEAHGAQIEAAIKEAEGRATARCIVANDLFDYASSIEKKLGISKKALNGCRFCVDPNAQNFPNAYKYTPESTQADLEYASGKWYLANVRRDRCSRDGHEVESYLTDEAKAALIKKYTTMSRWDLR